MSAPATAEDVIRLIRRSKLVEEGRLDAYLRGWDRAGGMPEEPRRLAAAFIRDGLLTFFQAEQVLLGKYRGFTLGKYRILERLGHGGMGRVFLCEHLFMRRRVAIKVLPPARAKEQSSLARFYREARATAALDHPNIVRSHDVDQDGDLHFLVMEYVDGVSLKKLVRKAGPLSVARACDYVRQAAVGLQHAHDAGLVHRDMKPGNLMVDRDGLVKILDLGLAQFRDDAPEAAAGSDSDVMLGTVDYVAPEQTVSGRVDARADVYGLGATFYFLLTGRPPFPEGSDADKLLAHRNATARPLAEFCDVPVELSELVGRMLAKSPADRPQACGAVAAALRPFCADAVAPPSDDELPRLSPAARGSAEPGRIPVAARPGGPTGRGGPGSSGSLSQFNLPQSGSGSRSSYSYRTKSAVGRGDTRAPDDTARTSRRTAADADQNPPMRWLVLVAAASALGACLGIMLWSRLAG
jgi:serine/threonine protein kinase